MPVKDVREAFLFMLSDVRQGAEHATKAFEEMRDIAENPEVKEALHARAFVSSKVVNTIDEAFKMLGEKPMEMPERLQEVLLEDFRARLGDMQSTEAKHLFVLAKAHQLNQIRIGEYTVLIEVADMMGHYGVGVLLSTCLADKMAFVQRTRHLMRRILEGKMGMRMAA